MRKRVAVNLRLFYWKTMKLDYLAETFVPELDLTASLLYYVRIKHRRYNTKLMQTRGKELLWGKKKKKLIIQRNTSFKNSKTQ